MLEIKLYGKKYNFDELKMDMRNWRDVNIIGALCKETLSWFYAYQPSTIAHLNNILKAADLEKNLDKDETEWIGNTKRLKDKLSSFDKNYKTFDTDKKDRYLREFTRDCALILDKMVEGSYKYYVMCSRMIFEKNERGIKSPIGLNIVDSKEEQ